MKQTRSARGIAVAGVLFLGLNGQTGLAAPFEGRDFTTISTAASPRVSYALEQEGSNLLLAIEVAPFGAGVQSSKPVVSVGLSADRTVMLSSDQSKVIQAESLAGGATRYTFYIPASDLVNAEAGWDRLRVGLAVRWPGGPNGADLQRERYRCIDGRATHADLSDSPVSWAPLSLAEHRATIAERRLAIAMQFEQPMDGRLTVVINDAQGQRVRNLVSGQSYDQGPVDLSWDGLDDNGNLVPPGEYRWETASHPGIKPVYELSFYNHGAPPWRDGTPGSGWLSDHCNPLTATAAGDRIWIGSVLSEAGNTIIQLTPDGKKTADMNKPAQIGFGAAFLAADDKYLYALNEGYSGYAGTLKDLGGGKWTCLRPSTVLRYDFDGKLVPFSRQKPEVVLSENVYEGTDVRRGARRRAPLPDNLGGAAAIDGKLYVSMRKDNAIVILDRESGETLNRFNVDQPGFVVVREGQLVLLSGEKLVSVDPASGKITPLFAPSLSRAMEYPPGNEDAGIAEKTARLATGLAIGKSGEIFVSDNGVDQNVKVFDITGKLLRQIGRQGGRPINGPWKTDGMYQPHGIAIDSMGQLWVTETDPQPRRLSVWDAATGAFKTEYLGPGRYGSPGGGFDHADGSRWIGGGVLWNIDMAGKRVEPVSTLYHATKPGQVDDELPSASYNFVHRDGRTFLVGQGKYTSVYELRADNSAKLWAICGTLGSIAQYPRWTLPKGLADVPDFKPMFEKDDGGGQITGAFNDRVTVNEQLLRGYGSAMWVDRDGDDVIEPDEVEVAPLSRTVVGPYWGMGQPSLDLRLLARVDDKHAVVTIAPNGYLPSGAPDYRFKQSLDAAVTLADASGAPPALKDVHAAVQDRFGRLLINASPMTAVDASGKVLWTYPNDWVSVHGSHKAPLPETGVIQGALWFLGTGALDEQGEVTIINGNHGRFFVMTTDGMYLDEIFQDVRVTQQRSAYHIGGEPFGGYFGRNDKDGKYYLQSGHTDYRIFRIEGIDQVKRGRGIVKVSAEQLAAASRRAARLAAAQQQVKSTMIPTVDAGATLDADPAKWPGSWTAQWGNVSRPFPFAQVRMVRQGDNLHLAYRVSDPSPWVNNGSDWAMLFKTGDSVNFEFSTDSHARADRTTPAKGDKRLLIGPMGNENVAVLYDYRTGDPDAKPVAFSSPWRAENVDRVTRLDAPAIDVKRTQGGYTLVAKIPLATLGLPATGDVKLAGDFGVIYGDEAGAINVLRSYWSNNATALVSDVPGEIAINPRMWATLRYTPQEAAR